MPPTRPRTPPAPHIPTPSFRPLDPANPPTPPTSPPSDNTSSPHFARLHAPLAAQERDRWAGPSTARSLTPFYPLPLECRALVRRARRRCRRHRTVPMRPAHARRLAHVLRAFARVDDALAVVHDGPAAEAEVSGEGWGVLREVRRVFREGADEWKRKLATVVGGGEQGGWREFERKVRKGGQRESVAEAVEKEIDADRFPVFQRSVCVHERYRFEGWSGSESPASEEEEAQEEEASADGRGNKLHEDAECSRRGEESERNAGRDARGERLPRAGARKRARREDSDRPATRPAGEKVKREVGEWTERHEDAQAARFAAAEVHSRDFLDGFSLGGARSSPAAVAPSAAETAEPKDDFPLYEDEAAAGMSAGGERTRAACAVAGPAHASQPGEGKGRHKHRKSFRLLGREGDEVQVEGVTRGVVVDLELDGGDDGEISIPPVVDLDTER